MKQLQQSKQEVGDHVSMLESFKLYSEAVTEKGTPCDVAVESASLRRRARELLDTDISRLARVEIEDADFQASDLMDRDVGRLSFGRRTGATQRKQTAITSFKVSEQCSHQHCHQVCEVILPYCVLTCVINTAPFWSLAIAKTWS